MSVSEGILFTDMYQLTMAQLYFQIGMHEKTVQFEHFFRDYPDYGTHKAGYCVNAGLAPLLEWMEHVGFGVREIEYLREQKSRTGKPLFQEEFLKWLKNFGNFSGISLRSIPEGRIIHPNEPINVVIGPLAMAQVLETSLLNHINYQILIATKAARMHQTGRGQPILEFGLRRAQGKGANAGTRAALIGGADFSSNVGVSYELGFEPKGTHAHSMVQLFISMGMEELDAFRAYADLYPDDCLLLVDTIDTLSSGIPNAIRVFEDLRSKGSEPVGIRLDSGDLAFLSIQAAKMLDEAGFEETSIVLSNDLDELVIWQILTQISNEASRYGMESDEIIKRLVYGVGTRLVTSWGEPALGGVYKLVAIQQENEWLPAIKFSESLRKIPNPGSKRLWRIFDQRGIATADLVALEDEDLNIEGSILLRHPFNMHKFRILDQSQILSIEKLCVQVMNEGRIVYDMPEISEIREQRIKDIERLDEGVLRIMNPHVYHISLSEQLWNLKQRLIREQNPGFISM
jgi:nicotinate phosphoribosyltransferase